MLNSLPVRLLWHSLNWLSRLIVVVSVIAAMLIAFSIIVLRYWLFPDIEQYHDKITTSLSAAIGNSVTIGKIQGEWRGFMPHLNFTNVRILDDQHQPALTLKRLNGSLSWMSLLTAELRLASLEIDSPELLIRREVNGQFFIGNLLLSKQGDNNDISDWLLHQSNVVVRNALIVWIDDQRDAPPLVLQQVNLRINNSFSRHRFALRAIPPNDLSTPLDVRGNFYGASFDNLDKWHGQLFTRLDYTDVTAWRPWLDLPGEFSHGRGALRAWLGVNDGKVTQITADLDLSDVATKLGVAVPEMTLNELRGRASWHKLTGGYEFSTRKLAMKLQDGTSFQPTDFYFRTVGGRDQLAIAGKTPGGEIRANLLRLDSLANLEKYLPMQADLRARLSAYVPRGKVSDLDAQWQGSLGRPDHYKFEGHFENLAINQVGKMPGFSGLTGDVDGSDVSGRVSINAHQMIVDAPGVMREPLSFTALIGQGGWRRKNGKLSINVDNIAVANDDLAGNFYGSYQTQVGTLGVLDLTGRLTRGNISSAARYTPLIALNKEGNDWLNGALLAGHTEDFRIRIKGNLSDFQSGGGTRCAQVSDEVAGLPVNPPADAGQKPDVYGAVMPPSSLIPLQKDGSEGAGNPPVYASQVQATDCADNVSNPDAYKDILFEIDGHAQDAVMEFDKSWPRIENISGEFMIRGNRLDVMSPSATILDTRLQNVTVTIPDMMSKDPLLKINGEATGASNSFLKFIQKSPVRDYIDGFTDGISAKGNGHLDLATSIPLSGNKPVTVSGTVKVQNNDIDFGKSVPLLRNTRGTLMFSESGIHASGISAQILGGKASISVRSEAGGKMHATIKGHSNVDVLRKTGSYPLLNYLHGSTDWDADIRVAKKSAQVTITSNLKGVSSTLPQPFAKGANETMSLRVEQRPVLSQSVRTVIRQSGKIVNRKRCTGTCLKVAASVSGGRDVISVHLGSLLNARLERHKEGGEMKIKRGIISFGAQDYSSVAKARKYLRSRNAPTIRLNSGVWLVGNLPELSMQGWGGLTGDGGSSGKNSVTRASAAQSVKPGNIAGKTAGYGPAFQIAGANLYIEKLTGYGQSFNALHVTATRRGDGLTARLSSNGLNGTVAWEPHGYKTGSMFRARLSNLQWSEDKQSKPSLQSVEPTKHILQLKNQQTGNIHPGDVPALDISIENLQVGEKHIGRLDLIGHPENMSWRLRRLNIRNPDGSLVGDGVWSDKQGHFETRLNLMLDISNAGKILARSGYPNTVKDGSGRLTADLSWAGMPDEFSYDTLNGSLKLDTGKGQFLKMDSGAGKLLSVLSLQDLPKHIVLGFTDVFSQGFQFDSISGNAAIKNGVIESDDFRIYGSSAKVTMKGKVDLKNETQNLTVKILPTLGDSMSLIGAFAISPVVGIGSLIVNKVLGNPLDKLASFEYNVRGSWRDPDVVKVGEFTEQPKQGNSGK